MENDKSILGPKPYRQLIFDQQSGKPIDYRDLLKNKIGPEGSDSGQVSYATSDAAAAGSATINNNVYNNPTQLLATISVTGSLFGAFGDGSDGNLTLSGNTAIALQNDIVVKRYNNLSLAGYTLSISAGQAAAIIFVNGTLNLGAGGIIKHSGNPYHVGNKTSTAMYGLNTSGSVPGGDGGHNCGTIIIVARTIVGSGTIKADGVVGSSGSVGINQAASGPGGSYGAAGSPAGAFPSVNNSVIFGVSHGMSGGVVATPASVGTPNSTMTAWYHDAWLFNSAHILNCWSAPLNGELDLRSQEVALKIVPFFFHGTGGDAASGGRGGHTGTATHGSQRGGSGGAGGTIFSGKPGGAGGLCGASGSGGATTTDVGNQAAAGAGGGGGGGGSGGFCLVRCSVNSTTTLVVSANGGAGGVPGASVSRNGTPSTGGATWVSGSGGGGGGGGGLALYDGPSNTGTTVTATGGAGGAGAVGAASSNGAVAGGVGANGSSGTVGYAYDCSYAFTLTGTGSSSTTLTEGSVLFADNTSSITQDNANFFYNNTTDALKLGGLTASGLVATDANKYLTSSVSALSPTLTGLTLSGLTATRVLFAGAGGLVSDDAGMTYVAATDTLSLGTLTAVTSVGVTASGSLNASQQLLFNGVVSVSRNVATGELTLATNASDITLTAASNIVKIISGTTAQTLRVYGDAAQYTVVAHNGTAGLVYSQSGNLHLGGGNNANWTMLAVGGHLTVAADNTYDLGTVTTARIRSGHFSTSIVFASGGLLSWSTDLHLSRIAAGVVAVKNAALACEVRVHGDATKYVSIRHDGSDSYLTSSSGALGFFVGATLASYYSTSFHLLRGTDNAYDDGQVGANRVRTYYPGTSIVFGTTGLLSWSTDLHLKRSAAGVLIQEDGTNVQTLRIYGTTTGPRYLNLAHDSTQCVIGDTANNNILINGTNVHLQSSLTFTDNAYDVGASGATRPRTIYAGTSVNVVAGAVLLDTNGITMGDAKNIIVNATTGTKIGTATTQKISLWNATPVVQQLGGVTVTNNVTAGGTTNQLDDFTSLTIYATDAAAIRNNIYQLGRKLKLITDALRTIGALATTDA